MTEFEIKEKLFKTKHLGKILYHFLTITSTQTFLKKLLSEETTQVGTIVLADQQRMGRGTQGRTWFGLSKPQLTFSILLQPTVPVQKFPIINVLCGILLVQTMKEIGIEAQIKWPNDVYIKNKKVAGILSELNTGQSTPRIMVGIGINVEASLDEFPTELQDKATALSLHSSKIPDRFKILESFLQKLEAALYDWSIEKLTKFTQEEFEKLWIYKDQPIEIRQDQKSFHGIARKINASGALELETKNGIEAIYSGSVFIDSSTR